MDGKYHITVDLKISPVVHPPRKVPVALQDAVKKELERRDSLDVIEKVQGPSDWVSSMVVIVKPNKLRLCMDPRDLNCAIKREHYPMVTVEEVAARMPKAKILSVLDASQGFLQVQLDAESSKLRTFNTPIWPYLYKRMHFGIKSAPEVFQRARSQIFQDLPGTKVIMDDLLIWDRREEEHDQNLIRTLDRAREANLKLCKKKSGIKLNKIGYVGQIFTSEGLETDPEKISAIREMPTPEDKTRTAKVHGNDHLPRQVYTKLVSVSV